MPRLTITYRDIPLFDGEVDEFTWSETANAVSVVGKTGRRGGLLELFTAGRRAAEPDAEPAEEATA